MPPLKIPHAATKTQWSPVKKKGQGVKKKHFPQTGQLKGLLMVYVELCCPPTTPPLFVFWKVLTRSSECDLI